MRPSAFCGHQVDNRRPVTIARGAAMNTVMKYVRMLEEKELIATEHTSVITKNGDKRNGNLLYHILPVKHALEEYYQWQIRNGGTNKKR